MNRTWLSPSDWAVFDDGERTQRKFSFVDTNVTPAELSAIGDISTAICLFVQLSFFFLEVTSIGETVEMTASSSLVYTSNYDYHCGILLSSDF